VTPAGGSPETLTASGSGPWTYTYTVTSSTANGLATITATVSDGAGNSASDTDTFNINKRQVTGQVELEGFVGTTSRVVTFVATGGTTKTWNLTLTGWASYKTSYTLTDVPSGTTGISAKTAWTLRERLTVAWDGDSQAVADFVSDGTAGWSDATDHYLRGGDINGSNSVNVLDYSILKMNWNTSNAVADINGSGLVYTTDYDLMKGNWFKTGDPE
jgi:hypothetical protein